MGHLTVTPTVDGSGVSIEYDICGYLGLTWPEANKLQYELRQACVDAGITLMGAV